MLKRGETRRGHVKQINQNEEDKYQVISFLGGIWGEQEDKETSGARRQIGDKEIKNDFTEVTKLDGTWRID